MKRLIGWATVAVGALATATTRYGYVKGYDAGSRAMREAFDAQERHAKRLTRREAVTRAHMSPSNPTI